MAEESVVHLVLDAEVLNRDSSRRRGAFRALSHVVHETNVQLHVPYVAAEEFITRQASTVAEEIQTATSALRGVRGRLKKDDRPALDDLAKRMAEAAADAEVVVRRSFDSWCRENRVIVDEISPEHGGEVMANYFAGRPPFRRPKTREDIPDAFILQALRKISASGEEVVFITGDAKLRSAAAEVVTETHASIEEFLRQQEIETFLRRGIVEKQMEAFVATVLDSLFEGGKVAAVISEALVGQRVSITFPTDVLATIQKVTDVPRIWAGDRVGYYGRGLVTFPFSSRALCEIAAELPAATAATLPTVADGYVTSHTDGSALLLMRRTYVVAGALLIAVPESILESETKTSAVRDAALSCEAVIDELRIQDGQTPQRPNFDEVMRHALDEAERQIAVGDTDAEIDKAEDELLAAQARWIDIPKEFHGKHGDITITPEARVLIRPLGRFETMVKIAKRSLFRMGEEDDPQPPSSA